MNTAQASNVTVMPNAMAISNSADTSSTALVLNTEHMNHMMDFAKTMASSKITIPKHLQGSQGDCFAVVMQAMQWGMNPFTVAQKTHLVNGVLGYEAQLVIAVINSRAPIIGRMKFDWFGDWSTVKAGSEDPKLGVTVSALMIGDDNPTELTLTMAQVGKVRNSPLWVADPKQQLAYLGAKRFSRLHCPDVIMGVYTPDELSERDPIDVTPQQPPISKTASVRDKVAAKKQGLVIDQPATVEPVEGGLEKVVSAIEIATSVEELAEYAKSFGDYGLSEAEIKQVNVAYKAKKQALTDAQSKDPSPEELEAIRLFEERNGSN